MGRIVSIENSAQEKVLGIANDVFQSDAEKEIVNFVQPNLWKQWLVKE